MRSEHASKQSGVIRAFGRGTGAPAALTHQLFSQPQAAGAGDALGEAALGPGLRSWVLPSRSIQTQVCSSSDLQ